MNNLSSYDGLVDVIIRASDKDLTVLKSFIFASSYDFSSENRALCFDAL